MSVSQAINSTSKRQRKASRIQQEINDELRARELEKLTRAQKDIEQKKKQLMKRGEQDADESEGPESQSDGDEGYGKVLGGRFTSVISSQGTVQTLGGTRVLKKRHLLRDDDTMSDPSEHTTRQTLHNLSVNGPRQTQSSPAPVTRRQESQGVDDLLNFDETEEPHRHEQSSPIHSESESRVQQSHHRNRSSAHSESTSHTQQSHRRNRSSTPPRSKSPENQYPPVKRVKLNPAPFRNGKVPGKGLKASDYEEGVEKMLLNVEDSSAGTC